MKIIGEYKTEIGAKYLLVNYGVDSFAYCVDKDLKSVCGIPIQQCGSKFYIVGRFLNLIELKEKNILHYEKRLSKDGQDGWNILIKNNQDLINMFEYFLEILRTL